MKVAAIVEGDGEVRALPILLRRLAAWRTPEQFPDVLPPIRVRRDRFIHRDDEFQKYMQLAATKCGDGGCVLLLLDADDDCPAETAPALLTKARATVPHRRIAVVLANREYEAWFIAAAPSLHGHRGFALESSDAVDAEAPRDAKGWMAARMASGSYGPTTDQPAFTAVMDLNQAFQRSRSFRKLCSVWDYQFARE